MSKHEAFSDEFIRYDWTRAWQRGCDMALEQSRRGDEITELSVMWALMCEAAKVSKFMANPPRAGFPAKSAMPDAPDDVTIWHKMSAYLNGTLEEMPETEMRPPTPSAEEVTRAEMVIELWHKVALRDMGDWRRMRKAVYLKACGIPDRKVRSVTGYSRQRIHKAKNDAMREMVYFVARC